MLMNWEDSYIQRQAGTIDASSMASDEAQVRTFLSIPAYRAVWKATQRQFTGTFRDYIDALMRELKGANPRRDLSTAWKARLTEELAAASQQTL